MRRYLLLAVTTVLLVTSVAACGAVDDLLGEHAGPEAPNTKPCAGPQGVGGAVPVGLGPGDLVAANRLDEPVYRESDGFPRRAVVWRILYVSTGIDTSDLQLVCGLVVAPRSGPRTDFVGSVPGTGRMYAWAHGTIGMEQRCQPSSGTAFWGPMTTGIGAVAWGVPILLDYHEGRARDGMLQYAVDNGWVVAATDYQPPDTYLAGRIAAANVLDANRAAAQLVTRTWPDTAPSRYRMVVAGHSQGGHSALFTGQLAEPYLAATQPSRPTASFELAGVEAQAPASNFVADPARQPALQFGDGLADAEMHRTVKPLLLDLPEVTVQIGPALFSYIFGSWAELSKSAVPPGASLPAFPTTGPLDLRDLTTAEGEATVAAMLPLCLGQEGKVQAATGKYRNAEAHRMLTPPIWNLPAEYSTGEYFKGGFDRLCATTTHSGVTAWCDWVRWNTPGPIGVNPYPKLPSFGGSLIPVLIAQGEDDDVVNCVAPGDQPAAEPTDAAHCSARSVYDELAAAGYCRAGQPAAGYLRMDQYREIPFQSPADHFSIRGQSSSKGQTKSADDLTYSGSPSQRFVDGAFAGSLAPACRVRVANAN
jgi:hypothetical protein